jgi:hypothetical protein
VIVGAAGTAAVARISNEVVTVAAVVKLPVAAWVPWSVQVPLLTLVTVTEVGFVPDVATVHTPVVRLVTVTACPDVAVAVVS